MKNHYKNTTLLGWNRQRNLGHFFVLDLTSLTGMMVEIEFFFVGAVFPVLGWDGWMIKPLLVDKKRIILPFILYILHIIYIILGIMKNNPRTGNPNFNQPGLNGITEGFEPCTNMYHVLTFFDPSVKRSDIWGITIQFVNDLDVHQGTRVLTYPKKSFCKMESESNFMDFRWFQRPSGHFL